VELLEAIVQDNPECASLNPDARRLDAVYVPSRYPNGLAGGEIPATYYGEKESQACVASAGSILHASIRIVRGSKRSPKS